jgi:hypothetical protein
MYATRPFAIATGASTGIGFELAKRCAQEGYDLLIAADEPEIEKAAASLRHGATQVEALQVDLATTGGVDKLYAAAKGRQVDALLANARRGLGHGFLDQDFATVRRVIDTNITATVYLIQKLGNDMRTRNSGKILITGSIAGFTPGSFQAVYNGTKAFLNSFTARRTQGYQCDGSLSYARRHRDGILSARRYDVHRGWNQREGRCRRSRQQWLRCDDEGRGRRRYRVQEQGAVRRRQCDAGWCSGETASQEGRIRLRKQMTGSSQTVDAL